MFIVAVVVVVVTVLIASTSRKKRRRRMWTKCVLHSTHCMKCKKSLSVNCTIPLIILITVCVDNYLIVLFIVFTFARLTFFVFISVFVQTVKPLGYSWVNVFGVHHLLCKSIVNYSSVGGNEINTVLQQSLLVNFSCFFLLVLLFMKIITIIILNVDTMCAVIFSTTDNILVIYVVMLTAKKVIT